MGWTLPQESRKSPPRSMVRTVCNRMSSLTNPAVTRSSRSELRSDCKHHWPMYEFVKSRCATFSVCIVILLKEAIATTRGLAEVCSMFPSRRLVRVKKTSSVALVSQIAFAEEIPQLASQTAQEPLSGPLSRLDETAPAPAHASAPMSSKTIHWSCSDSSS